MTRWHHSEAWCMWMCRKAKRKSTSHLIGIVVRAGELPHQQARGPVLVVPVVGHRAVCKGRSRDARKVRRRIGNVCRAASGHCHPGGCQHHVVQVCRGGVHLSSSRWFSTPRSRCSKPHCSNSQRLRPRWGSWQHHLDVSGATYGQKDNKAPSLRSAFLNAFC